MKVINNPNQNPVAQAERDKRVAEPGFGKYYTDNMVIAEWSEATGWADAKLQPYGPITLDPAAMVFHYGQEIFEGMKAYSQPDGGVSLFRPDANAKRFAKSAASAGVLIIGAITQRSISIPFAAAAIASN